MIQPHFLKNIYSVYGSKHDFKEPFFNDSFPVDDGIKHKRIQQLEMHNCRVYNDKSVPCGKFWSGSEEEGNLSINLDNINKKRVLRTQLSIFHAKLINECTFENIMFNFATIQGTYTNTKFENVKIGNSWLTPDPKIYKFMNRESEWVDNNFENIHIWNTHIDGIFQGNSFYNGAFKNVTFKLDNPKDRSIRYPNIFSNISFDNCKVLSDDFDLALWMMIEKLSRNSQTANSNIYHSAVAVYNNFRKSYRSLNGFEDYLNSWVFAKTTANGKNPMCSQPISIIIDIKNYMLDNNIIDENSYITGVIGKYAHKSFMAKNPQYVMNAKSRIVNNKIKIKGNNPTTIVIP